MSASLNSISIVIPVYNGGESFRQCLTSIQASSRPADEVVVVSDGDSDNSWRVATEFGATVLRLPTTGGPARARNIGARAAQGDIIFFVDADVTLHPETIALVEQQFQTRPDLAALIGSYDDAPGSDNFLSQYKNLFHHYTHQVSSDIAFTFWGACGAIRRSVFHTIDGFDETYRHPCIEDIELGYRLTQAGYLISLCKHIQVKHLKRWEPLSLLKADILYRALPWTELLLRDRRFNGDLNLNLSNRLSVIGVFALVVSLAVSSLFFWFWFITAALILGLLVINADVYRFFYAKRGLLFTLRVIPWHWLYFFYGGATFAYGVAKYSLTHWLSSEVRQPTDSIHS